MDNLEIFKGYDSEYKGTLVLEHFNVVLFKGMILDQEDDYYYDLLKEREEKSYWMSGVGRIVFLKSVLDADDYSYLVQVWNYNNEEKAI
jgi:hypothetical protein